MLREDLREWVGMAWPYAVALLTVAGLVFAVWKFMPSYENSEIVDVEARIFRLSERFAFRNAYLMAQGGEDSITELRSILARGSFQSGERSIPFRSIKRWPDKSITTLEFPDYDVSFVVNGDVVWRRIEVPDREPVDTRRLGEDADALAELGRFFSPLTRVVMSNPESITNIERGTWKGEPCLVVEFYKDEHGPPLQAYVDPLTLTPHAEVETLEDGTRREVVFQDYDAILGKIKQPLLIDIYVDAERQTRMTIDSIEANPGVVSKIFEFTGETERASVEQADDTALAN